MSKIRKQIYSIEDILKYTLFIPKKDKFSKDKIKYFSGKECKVMFDGEKINMASDRYKLFSQNHKCVCCGLEGSFMAMEKNENDVSYHFNMYGLDGINEILFTKDHIIPKSKGGKDDISNYQTMCVICNGKKSNKEK